MCEGGVGGDQDGGRCFDSSYPHDGRADKNPYSYDRRADKDSYPHDSNNQCIILKLQLSFVMINVQLITCLIDFILFFDICSILQQISVNIIILFGQWLFSRTRSNSP